MADDPRPLSERFDLRYVQRRSWPYAQVRWLSFAAIIAGAAYLAASWWLGDQRAFSSGDLSEPHALFADHCDQCHQPDPDRSGYWLPASDAACLRCHSAPAHPDPHARLYSAGPVRVGDRLADAAMAGNCAACHVEHRGRDHDLSRVDDRFCVQCHRDLRAYAAAANPAGEGAR